MSQLSGKVAIVTGAGRGIGAAVAIGLSKCGADVVINYSTPSTLPKAEEVSKAVEANGSKALIVQADIGTLEGVDQLIKQTVDKFGKIDILVNNGGVLFEEPVGTITPEAYQKTFDVNVRGVIFLSQGAAAHMGDGGRIINVSSISARFPMDGQSTYAASKAAVDGMTRVMAMELRSRGIRVTNVNPGPVKTDMFHNLPTEKQNYIKSNMPLADPEDIADIIIFLASPQSRWVNASTVNANNGVVPV